MEAKTCIIGLNAYLNIPSSKKLLGVKEGTTTVKTLYQEYNKLPIAIRDNTFDYIVNFYRNLRLKSS